MNNFISIESTDGVGKTTIAKALAQKLNYEFTEKPVHQLFDSQNSMDIYLNMADNIHSIDNKNLRAMFYGFSNMLLQEVSQNKNIVTDRHILSNLCWQKTVENKEIFDFIVKNTKLPDLTIILTADEETIRNRIKNRNPNDPDLLKVHLSQHEIKTIINYAKEYNFTYHVIDTTNKTVDMIVDEIIVVYNLFLNNKIINLDLLIPIKNKKNQTNKTRKRTDYLEKFKELDFGTPKDFN